MKQRRITVKIIATLCSKTGLLIILSLFMMQCSDGNHGQAEEERQPKLKRMEGGEYGEFAPKDAWVADSSYAYYGSENALDDRFFHEDRRRELYKRVGQAQMLTIVKGNLDSAKVLCDIYKYIKNKALDDPRHQFGRFKDPHPINLESLFNLTVIYSMEGKIDKAFKTMKEVVDEGLPFNRFLAGPRDYLSPLTSSPQFKQYYKKHEQHLIHGPMVGQVTPHSAAFWLRMWDEKSVIIKLFREGSNKPVAESEPVQANPEKDYTATAKVKDLQPNTLYSYNVFVDGEPLFDQNKLSFKTYPQEESHNHIRIGYGGCIGYTPWHERIWNQIAAKKFNAFFLLGDNPYLDQPGMPNAFHKYSFYRFQSRPEFEGVIRNTPTYATWDDHEFVDDIWMGPYISKPEWKLPYLEWYQSNWNNPGHADPFPGMWHKVRIGDVEVFMLDGRFYRTNPYRKPSTMLGPVQLQWLLNGLKKSTATFKLIASGVPWAYDSKPGSHDTWSGFTQEREQIFSFIEDNKIPGVVLLAGDRHRAEARKISRKNGYDLYSFENSNLTNIHTHPKEKGAIFDYNKTNMFGELDIDTGKADPTLTYKIININGKTVDSLTIKHSQLDY